MGCIGCYVIERWARLPAGAVSRRVSFWAEGLYSYVYVFPRRNNVKCIILERKDDRRVAYESTSPPIPRLPPERGH